MGLFDQDDDQPFAEDDKVRLFQTQQQTARSSTNYLKLLFLVALIVAAAGAIVYYVTLPGIGDRVLGPMGQWVSRTPSAPISSTSKSARPPT